MAPLLLLVLHLYLSSLMLYVSLLDQLYLQAKQHYQSITSHDQQTTNYQTQTQSHITSINKPNGSLINIFNNHKTYKLLQNHTHYHIIHLFEIILEMIKIHIIQHYLLYYIIHMVLNKKVKLKYKKKRTDNIISVRYLTLLFYSDFLTISRAEYLLSMLLLLVYIYLFLKERRIFTLIFTVLFDLFYFIPRYLWCIIILSRVVQIQHIQNI